MTTSASRWRGCWSSRPTSPTSTPACRAAPTRRSPASPRKAVKEVAYHLDHATQWVLRLGDGTDESHRRMQAALDAVWPYADELFDAARSARWPAAVVDPAALRGAVLDRPHAGSSSQATLTVPEVAPALGGGRAGPPHRAPGPPARRDAAPPPLTPGSDLVTCDGRSTPSPTGRADARARPGRDGARPRAPARDHRGPRHPPRRHRGRPGTRPRDHHPDVLRLPGDGGDPRRPRRDADLRRLPARRRRVRAQPRLDHRR